MHPESGPSTRPRGLAFAAGLASLLAGCAVGPDFKRPEANAPNGYTAEKLDPAAAAGAEAQQSFAIGKRISGNWWELFHSTQLNAVLELALAGNQDLAAAQATLA